ncbi:hypothetical protein AWC27_19685 [Mycobacterium szulgai]|uniref:Uncharacterized protein n=1 Tax=Mycobacterium szulgai TaxID=1787 RepID=A0A1X2F6V0_MYCSZ|nr:hypothetical protein AWC27_19685 [Mycobacterium szulgai]
MTAIAVSRLNHKQVSIFRQLGWNFGWANGFLRTVVDVTSDYDTPSARTDYNSRGAEHVAGGEQCDFDIADLECPTVGEFLKSLLSLHHFCVAIWRLRMVVAGYTHRIGFRAHHLNGIRPYCRK